MYKIIKSKISNQGLIATKDIRKNIKIMDYKRKQKHGFWMPQGYLNGTNIDATTHQQFMQQLVPNKHKQ